VQTPSTPARTGDRPLVCPACGSTVLTTASKTVDASTYWNCTACGEVWNMGRRQEPNNNRYAYPRR
jgi:ribosomal protein L37AE/L43A